MSSPDDPASPLDGPTRKTYERALDLLAVHARSARGLEKRLLEKGEPPAQVAAAIARLCAAGLLDDARFAAARARSGILGKARSRRRMTETLANNGVARDVAAAAIQQVLDDEGTDEHAVALRAAQKKLRIPHERGPARPAEEALRLPGAPGLPCRGGAPRDARGARRAASGRGRMRPEPADMTLDPLITSPEQVDCALRDRGYAVLDAAGLSRLLDVDRASLDALSPYWTDLPRDPHLRDGGRYRRRRHACFVVEGEGVRQVPHRAHWQPTEYNALHGGIHRWFDPVDAAMIACPAWARLLSAIGRRASALRGAGPWYVEAHPFRIDTSDGIGRPTPEGAHRDGVDLVAVLLVERRGVKGGETHVFEAAGPRGVRFTLREPWTTLLLDDARVVHETTPIQPLAPEVPGWRDTLVLTYRGGGFQEPR